MLGVPFAVWILAACVTCALTWLEIDQTLYVPPNTQRRTFIRMCILTFIAVNGILSAGLYFLFVDNPGLQSFSPPFRALGLGLAYPALVRVKFTTLKIEGKEVSVGLDAIYENIKNSLYKRIQRTIREAEFQEVREYASQYDLEHLLNRARFDIDRNLSISPTERENARNWCLRLENDTDAGEEEKRIYLADFILSGRRR